MKRVAAVPVLLLAVLPLLAKPSDDDGPRGRRAVLLKLTCLDEGSPPFYQESRIETTQKMTVMGQEVMQRQDQTVYIKWMPRPRDKEGNYVVSVRFIAVKIDLDIGGNKVVYDSTAPMAAAGNPLATAFEEMLKHELTFTVRPGDLQVIKVQGREQFAKNVGAGNPLIEAVLSEEGLKTMVNSEWWVLPQDAVAPGRSWSSKRSVELGPIARMEASGNFTYEGQNADGLDRIKADIKVRATEPMNADGLPFVVKALKLDGDAPKGEILFDRKRGRVVSAKQTMHVKGTMTISIGNMDSDVTLDQTQTAVVRSFDRSPIRGKE